MLLIYSLKTTQRITYIFKHICTRVLGIEVGFTSVIETFIAHSGPKLSYGKKPLGNELFLQSTDLLTQQGFDDFDISVKDWDETKCFFAVGRLSALPFDIFSASFYLLTRYEEYLPHVKDEKGRFLATESIAFKEGFLQKPVVDIWAYKFKNLLGATFSQLDFPRKKINIHTLVNANQPFAYKNKGMLRSISGIIKDVSKLEFKSVLKRLGVIFTIKNDPFNTFEWIIKTLNTSKSKATVFFLIGESVNFEEGVNSKRKTFQLLLKNVADYHQIGLVISKESLSDFELLKKEKEEIEAITNRTLVSAMNDEYIVSLPNNYRNLIAIEVANDYTMVYENKIGFRASTCTPFLFYDLDYEIVTPLLINPIAMTTASFKNIKDTKNIEKMKALKEAVNQVNGTFSVVFYNKDFDKQIENSFWRNVLINLLLNE